MRGLKAILLVLCLAGVSLFAFADDNHYNNNNNNGNQATDQDQILYDILLGTDVFAPLYYGYGPYYYPGYYNAPGYWYRYNQPDFDHHHHWEHEHHGEHHEMHHQMHAESHGHGGGHHGGRR